MQKIAILRANALGDTIFALPAVAALRATYPQAEIVWPGTELHKELLTGRPSPVDRILLVPPSRGVREEPGRQEDPAEVEQFFAAMQREAFDLACQLHGGGRYSNPFVQRLGTRLTIGLRTPDAFPLVGWSACWHSLS